MADVKRCFRERDLVWYHYAMLADMRRIADLGDGTGGYSVAGLASNAGRHTTRRDAQRMMDTFESLGFVEACDPEFDAGSPWYRITDRGREFLATIGK